MKFKQLWCNNIIIIYYHWIKYSEPWKDSVCFRLRCGDVTEDELMRWWSVTWRWFINILNDVTKRLHLRNTKKVGDKKRHEVLACSKTFDLYYMWISRDVISVFFSYLYLSVSSFFSFLIHAMLCDNKDINSNCSCTFCYFYSFIHSFSVYIPVVTPLCPQGPSRTTAVNDLTWFDSVVTASVR